MWYYEGGIRIEPDWNVKQEAQMLITTTTQLE